jgi:predicted heme/steroid binding protein
MSDKTFTPAEVATHNNPEKGLYIIIDQSVYDVTNFVDEHPGGVKILKRMAGKDATKQFWKVCRVSFSFLLAISLPLSFFLVTLKIGRLPDLLLSFLPHLLILFIFIYF